MKGRDRRGEGGQRKRGKEGGRERGRERGREGEREVRGLTDPHLVVTQEDVVQNTPSRRRANFNQSL